MPSAEPSAEPLRCAAQVYGVDAIEDYTHDLQYRFDSMPPYSEMAGVVKRTESFAISRVSGGHINFFGPVRKNANCCADHCLLPPPFCCGRRSQRLEHRGSDHICIPADGDRTQDRLPCILLVDTKRWVPNLQV